MKKLLENKSFNDLLFGKKVETIICNIVLVISTFGLWIAFWLFCYIYKNKYNIQPIENKPVESKPQNIMFYEKEFALVNPIEHNIQTIIDENKSDIDLYGGMTNSEIKDFGWEVGEVDSQPTPDDIRLKHEVTKTLEYISVQIYCRKYDKWLKVGVVPKEEQEEILKYINYNVLVWGSYVGGTFKDTDENYNLIKTKKDLNIKVLIKIFEK